MMTLSQLVRIIVNYRQLYEYDYWNRVKGKRFRVVKVTPCYKPNRDYSDVRKMTLGQVYEKVHKAILNGNGSLVKTMLVPQGCYDFEEI